MIILMKHLSLATRLIYFRLDFFQHVWRKRFHRGRYLAPVHIYTYVRRFGKSHGRFSQRISRSPPRIARSLAVTNRYREIYLVAKIRAALFIGRCRSTCPPLQVVAWDLAGRYAYLILASRQASRFSTFSSLLLLSFDSGMLQQLPITECARLSNATDREWIWRLDMFFF